MLRRFALVPVALAFVLVLAAPAWAHVTIDPTQVPAGSDAELTFSVPNEMDNANTTQLQVFFPTDHPIASAKVKPIPGWTFGVQMMQVTTPISTDSGNVTQAVQSVLDRWCHQAWRVPAIHRLRRPARQRDVARVQGAPDLRQRSSGPLDRHHTCRRTGTRPSGPRPDPHQSRGHLGHDTRRDREVVEQRLDRPRAWRHRDRGRSHRRHRRRGRARDPTAHSSLRGVIWRWRRRWRFAP